MGTETCNSNFVVTVLVMVDVKLNNPLMGTETFLFSWVRILSYILKMLN